MSKRDTKFANFAQLLARELTTAGVFYETTGIGQFTIAQRAYDLLFHAVKHSLPYPQSDRVVEHIVLNIPDLTTVDSPTAE